MGKIALVFPGQGSQQVGMGKLISEHSEVARRVFAEADEVLEYSLSTLCFEGPEEKLRLTMYTQPAILTTSMAVYAVFQELGIQPHFVAGHSLGEYSALVASGVLSFAEAVATVRKRGMYMEEAVPAGTGAMSAVIQCDRGQVVDVCQTIRRSDYVVEPANFNSPGQIVISGHADAVKEAGDKLQQVGARRVVPLPVSGPFHSALMRPAADRLQRVLDELHFHDAKISVVTNVAAKPVMAADTLKTSLIEQVYSPVLWEDSVVRMVNEGVDTFIEIGPGSVLSGLIRKIDRSVTAISIQNAEDIATLKEKL